MGPFKNIKNSTNDNATYAAYKKLTAQDVVTTTYSARKQFTITGADLKSNGIYSFLTDHNIP